MCLPGFATKLNLNLLKAADCLGMVWSARNAVDAMLFIAVSIQLHPRDTKMAGLEVADIQRKVT